MRSKVFRTDKYLIVAGSFLFVSAFVVYHGSRHVLLEYFNENRFQFDDHQPQFLEDSTEPVDPLENQIFDEKITCGCDSLSRLAVLIQSTCSYEADERGFNQSVISYSLFGKPDEDDNVRKRYFSTISDKAGRIARYYPGWIMRVYHNLTKDQEIQYLCPLRCKHSNVDLCHVEKIHTKEITNALIQRANPRMWRFLVMLDPLVDRFMSRDVDSEIIPRETAAVKQWLRSKYTFHVMRDHPSHGGFMLAGLWGAKSFQRRQLIQRLAKAMIWTSQNDNYDTDQIRLDFFVWPFATFDVMAHDAYFCNNWMLSIGQMVPTFPFPTRRVGHNYTGLDLVRTDIADHIVPCPVECRPVKHKDWLFC